MVGAMVVVLVFVLGFIIFRALNRDNSGVHPESVNYQPIVAEVRADAGHLTGWAPTALPQGWWATAATYSTQQNPHWHLGATNGKDYLGIEEGMDSLSAELGIALQGSWTAAGSVQSGGYAWSAYTDTHGNYALAREMASKTPRYPEWLVVVGSTSPQQVQAYAASLKN